MKKSARAGAGNGSTDGVNKGNGKSASTGKAADAGYLHVAMAKRSREGLNKLVAVMEAKGQRQVLEQLIADELHRRGMRMPRV